MKRVIAGLVLSSFIFGDVVEVNLSKTKELLANNIFAIDVRTEAEWKDTGTLAKVEKITFFDKDGNYDTKYYQSVLESKKISKDTPILLVCKSGKRSRKAAEILDKAGYKNVYASQVGVVELANSGEKLVK